MGKLKVAGMCFGLCVGQELVLAAEQPLVPAPGGNLVVGAVVGSGVSAATG